MKKIINLTIAIAFFVNSICYGLGTMPLSARPGDSKRQDVYEKASALWAGTIGPAIASLLSVLDSELKDELEGKPISIEEGTFETSDKQGEETIARVILTETGEPRITVQTSFVERCKAIPQDQLDTQLKTFKEHTYIRTRDGVTEVVCAISEPLRTGAAREFGTKGKKVAEEIQKFITEYILPYISINEAAEEAQAILNENNRYLYYGNDYLAISSSLKDKAIFKDREKAKAAAKDDGITVAFGDSGGDLPFLEAEIAPYLPLFVGEKKLGEKERSKGIIQAKRRGIEDSRAILQLMLNANGKMTNRDFFEELSKLTERHVNVPESLSQEATFRLSTVYADKDGTLVPTRARVDDGMADLIADVILSGARFVVVTSNRTEEVKLHLLEPVREKLAQKTGNNNKRLNAALSRFETYNYNSIGHIIFENGKWVSEIKGVTIADNAKTMLFKIYTRLLIDYLRSNHPEINFDETSIEKVLNAKTSKEAQTAFDEMVLPHQKELGVDRKAEIGHDNLFIDTWGDAFVTIELAAAKRFFHGEFPKYADNGVRTILAQIISAVETKPKQPKSLQTGAAREFKAEDGSREAKTTAKAGKEITPKVVFFDIDGVLFRRPENRRANAANALSKYGITITADELENVVYGPARKQRNAVMKGDVTADEFLSSVNSGLKKYGLKRNLTREEFFGAFFADRKPNRKLASFIADLKAKGIKVGIVSDRLVGDEALFRRMIHKAFPHAFDDKDIIFFSSELNMKKREPGLFELVKETAARKFNATPEEILFVDDHEENVKFAEESGIKGLLYVFHDQKEAPDPASYPVLQGLLVKHDSQSETPQKRALSEVGDKARKLLELIRNAEFINSLGDSGLRPDEVERFKLMLGQLEKIIAWYFQEGDVFQGDIIFLGHEIQEVFNANMELLSRACLAGDPNMDLFYTAFVELVGWLKRERDLRKETGKPLRTGAGRPFDSVARGSLAQDSLRSEFRAGSEDNVTKDEGRRTRDEKTETPTQPAATGSKDGATSDERRVTRDDSEPMRTAGGRGFKTEQPSASLQFAQALESLRMAKFGSPTLFGDDILKDAHAFLSNITASESLDKYPEPGDIIQTTTYGDINFYLCIAPQDYVTLTGWLGNKYVRLNGIITDYVHGPKYRLLTIKDESVLVELTRRIEEALRQPASGELDIDRLREMAPTAEIDWLVANVTEALPEHRQEIVETIREALERANKPEKLAEFDAALAKAQPAAQTKPSEPVEAGTVRKFEAGKNETRPAAKEEGRPQGMAPERSQKRHYGTISDIAVNKTGYSVVQNTKKQLWLFNPSQELVLKETVAHEDFKLTDTYLATRDTSGAITVRDIKTGRAVLSYEYGPHGFWLTETHLATRKSHHRITVRDLKTGEIVPGFENIDGLLGLELTDTHLVTHDSHHRITVRDLKTGEIVPGFKDMDKSFASKFKLAETDIEDIVMIQSVRNVLVGDRITVKDLKTGEIVPDYKEIDKFYVDEFGLTKTHLATGDLKGRITVKDLKTGKIVPGFENIDGLLGLELTDTHLVTCDSHHRITVRDLKTGKIVPGFENIDGYGGVELTKTHLATQSLNRRLTLRELKTGRVVKRFKNTESPHGFRLNETHLTTHDLNGQVTVVDVRTGEIITSGNLMNHLANLTEALPKEGDSQARPRSGDTRRTAHDAEPLQTGAERKFGAGSEDSATTDEGRQTKAQVVAEAVKTLAKGLPLASGEPTPIETGAVLDSVRETTPAPATPALPTLTAQDNLTIDAVYDFIDKIARGEGAGPIEEANKLVDESTQTALWTMVNLFHKEELEVLVTEEWGNKTETVTKAIRAINNKLGRDAIALLPCQSVEKLEQELKEGDATSPHKKRIIITGERSSKAVESLLAGKPELFKGKRLLNMAPPQGYEAMNTKDKTVWQVDMLTKAVFSRLYINDGSRESLMIRGILQDLFEGKVTDLNDFLDNLGKPIRENETNKEIAERINYFLGKIVKLLELLDRELRIMRVFWTYA